MEKINVVKYSTIKNNFTNIWLYTQIFMWPSIQSSYSKHTFDSLLNLHRVTKMITLKLMLHIILFWAEMHSVFLSGVSNYISVSRGGGIFVCKIFKYNFIQKEGKRKCFSERSEPKFCMFYIKTNRDINFLLKNVR